MLRQAKQFFTPAEYLRMEEAAEYKSEFYNGEIFAMAGGTRDHSLIAVNLVGELRQQLKQKPCRVYNSDLRLLVERGGLYTYPDVMVVCGKVELVKGRNDLVTNPILLVEVLSESTRDYDRGAKFDFYKQIPTLREYVLVESERLHVQVERRGKRGNWIGETFDGLGASVRLGSIECEISMQGIYDKVSWL